MVAALPERLPAPLSRYATLEGHVFENDLPKRKIGVLSPLSVIDNSPYEFYRLVKDRVMLVMIPVGLREFTGRDVERVFAPIDSYLDKLMERRVDIIVQSGVPLPALIGTDAHDRMIAHIAGHAGRPATSSVLGVVEAAKSLGIRKIAFANKWSDAMNATLGEFFARENIAVAGTASKVLAPSQFQKLSGEDNIELAYALGREALTNCPDADGLYIGGGAWLSQPPAEALEAEFGRPVITNVAAMIRNVLKLLDCWKPIPGHGRLLAME
jgi:maleate cis-trans isomerase